MIIDLKKLSNEGQTVETTEDVLTKNMELSSDATAIVFQMFTKNIYSNPIGSIVREITSNCFDSHVEAKVNKPVVIKLSFDKQSNTHYISFIDFGTGMSPDRTANVYSVYFESTKRTNNEEIGGFGIGGKTPLAYKRKTGEGTKEYDNSFYVITNYNNTKYYYMIYEGEFSPIISLLHSEKTDEENGTEVRIPVLENDIYTFASNIKKQLYYFENLVFEGFENYSDVTNDYTIYNAKTFLYRGNGVSSSAHVCLGRVAYPIDFSTLGISAYQYNIPIGIKFDIGELNVTANREALDYSEETIKLIKERLTLAMSELKELATKQYQNVKTLEDYFNFIENFGEITLTTKNITQSDGSVIKKDVIINVRDIVNADNIELNNFKYKDIKIPNSGNLFHRLFTYKTYGKKPSTRSWSNNKTLSGSYKGLKEDNRYYYIADEFNRKVIKQSYLKHIHTTYFIVQKLNLYENSVIRDIIYDFNLENKDNSLYDKMFNDEGLIIKSNVDKTFKLFFELQEDYFKIIKKYSNGHYDDLVVPDDYVVKRKKMKNVIGEKLSITVRFADKERKDNVPLKSLFNANFLIFYGTSDDEYELIKSKRLYEAVFNEKALNQYDNYSGFRKRWNSERKNKGVIFIQIAKNNVRYLKDVKNAYHVNEFAQKLLRRKLDIIQTYLTMNNTFQSYMMLPDMYKDEDKFMKIKPQLAHLIKNVNNYIQTNDIESIVRMDEIKYCKDFILNKFNINFDNIQKDNEQIKFANDVRKLVNSYDKNKEILNHINIPYHLEDWNKTITGILKKVMVF